MRKPVPTTTNTILTILGTCGVCEREIACQDGKLVHHGYKRPGHGSIIGDCFAVEYAPYERSTAASQDYKRLVEVSITSLKKWLAELESGAVTYIGASDFRGHAVEYVAGVTDYWRWTQQLERTIRECGYEIKRAQAEVARMQRLIDGFELRELGSETRAGQKTREEREAREAEKAAKRAVRDEKARVLAAKKAVRADKEEALKAKYRGELEALAEKMEALDALRAPATKFAALDVIARWAKECKKTPKVHFHARDLKWEELFIRLGLATRTASGWVEYHVYNIGD